jgi:anti-sigma regulatory factor (Ser/Thr protein kinase)
MDFFVSYTSADRAWAEWIAWQLESEGYQVVVQAWDFSPGNDWAHDMQLATSTADRVVAVLSPDYLRSKHVEAEWRVFYAKDPSGEQRLLLPVRVRDVDPSGLLKTRIYVDLVNLDAVSAQKALLTAARKTRGKPTDEPEFPGGLRRSAAEETDSPQFPGDLLPTSGGGVRLEPWTATLRANDAGAVRAFAEQMSESLRRYGFSNSDINAFQISLHEIVLNVATHVRHKTITLISRYLVPYPKYYYEYKEGMFLEITDKGKGFDLENALTRADVELLEHGVEHGLLRAYRHGSKLAQASRREPHTMAWVRERFPQTVPAVFGGDNVIPLVISYRQEAVRIWRNIHTFFQFAQYIKRSDAFMDLIFDPLIRPARKYVGIEITGEDWSAALHWQEVLDPLLEFTKRNTEFNKRLLLFADASPSFQRELRKYCQKAGILMFEDESVIRDLDESAIQNLEQQK